MKVMKRKKAKVIIPVVVVCGILGGIFVPRALKSDEAVTVSAPQYYTVARDTLSTTITASASVTMPRQSKLTFGVDGIIKEIYVDFGDTVTQGQVLAELDTTDSLERALEQAEGNLTIAQADLDELQNPSEATIAKAQAAVASAKASLQNAQSTLEIAQDAGIGDVAQAQTAVDDAQLALNNAELDLLVAQNNAATSITSAENAVTTQEDLYYTVINNYVTGKATIEDVNTQIDNLASAQASLENARASAEKSLANAESAVTKARNALLEAQVALNNAINGVSIAQKEAAVESARATLLDAEKSLSDTLAGGNAETLITKKLQVSNAQAAVDDAEENITKATITAPFDGVIAASISVQEGDNVSSGTTIMQLVDTSEIQIEAAIDEVDVFDVAAGQEVDVTFEYLSDLILSGTVKAVSPLATSSSGVVSYDALVLVNDVPQDVQFYEGLTATIDIIITESENVLVVPAKAITTTSGVKTVQVMVNGIAQTRTITVGVTSGTETEVTSGLAEGEEILVSGTVTTSSGSTAVATATTNITIGGGMMGGGVMTGGGGAPPAGGGGPPMG